MPDLRAYLGTIDSYLGDDDDVLGARARTRGGGPTRRPHAGMGLNRAAAQALASPMAGIPNEGARIEPLGWPNFGFVAGGPTSITLISRPQKPMKGGRLVLAARASGATAVVQLPLMNQLLIGSRPLLINSNPVSVDAFAATAFGVELNMDEAAAALDLALTISIVGPALAGADVVNVSATLFGLTWS